MHLIRFGADETGLHAVDGGIKRLGAGKVKVEATFHLAKEELGKPAPAPDLVFINPALAFMHPHRHAAPKRRQLVIGVDVQLVAGMPHLMDGGIDAIKRIAFHHPRRDAAVRRRPAREWMHRQINPPAAKVIAKGQGQIARQAQLRGLAKAAHQSCGRCLSQDSLAQRHQSGPHPTKHRPNAFRRGTGFVIIQEGVIQITPLRQTSRFFAAQRDNFSQSRQKICHAVVRARLCPNPLRHRSHLRQLLRQIAGHLGRALIAARDQAQLGAPRRILRVARLDQV